MATTQDTNTKSTKTNARATASEFAAADFTGTQFTPFVREFVEKAGKQVRENYSRFQSATSEANAVLEQTANATRDGIVELGEKTAENVRAQNDAAFALTREILNTKSLNEIYNVQYDFARKQFAANVENFRNFQEAASRMAEAVTAPARNAVQKTWQNYAQL